MSAVPKPKTDSALPSAVIPQTEIRPAPRVAPRVPIAAIHRLSYMPESADGTAHDTVKLCNISVSGVGLMATAFKPLPKVGDIIGGSLMFEEGSFPIKLKVMHVTNGVLGARFEGDSRGLRDAIRSYFEVELLALGMLKVNPAHHKPESDGQGHWIHGDQCELYYVQNAADQLLRFRLTFVGNRFSWAPETGLVIGLVADNRSGIMRTDTFVEAEATAETADFAMRFLQNIVQLPPEHRALIASKLPQRA